MQIFSNSLENELINPIGEVVFLSFVMNRNSSGYFQQKEMLRIDAVT